TGAMTAFGLGCAAPPGVSQEQHNQWIGNGVFAVLYMAMCQANFGKCPFPLGPSDPAPAP
ncbi:MAG TPA: hypothetical protein VL068_09600, partial [Microthrixaceae bacterium]|nr:hypothetical protein [Microthrixaceae bacterium]